MKRHAYVFFFFGSLCGYLYKTTLASSAVLYGEFSSELSGVLSPPAFLHRLLDAIVERLALYTIIITRLKKRNTLDETSHLYTG